MNSDIRNRAKLFHDAIHCALLWEWDPIGIREISEAVDEYDAYIPTLYKMLIAHKPRHELVDYLWWLETEHMALRGDRQATEKFADRLLELTSELDFQASPKPAGNG